MNGERTPDELVGDGVIIAGRGIGKGGFVSALCDPGRDRVIKAEVAIVAPGVGTREDRLIGLFCGRPMTVISKPSKRRQAVSSCSSSLFFLVGIGGLDGGSLPVLPAVNSDPSARQPCLPLQPNQVSNGFDALLRRFWLFIIFSRDGLASDDWRSSPTLRSCRFVLDHFRR